MMMLQRNIIARAVADPDLELAGNSDYRNSLPVLSPTRDMRGTTYLQSNEKTHDIQFHLNDGYKLEDEDWRR